MMFMYDKYNDFKLTDFKIQTFGKGFFNKKIIKFIFTSETNEKVVLKVSNNKGIICKDHTMKKIGTCLLTNYDYAGQKQKEVLIANPKDWTTLYEFNMQETFKDVLSILNKHSLDYKFIRKNLPTLKDLILKFDFKVISPILVKYYEGTNEEMLKNYSIVYEQLKQLNTKKSKYLISIDHIVDDWIDRGMDDGFEDWYTVHGTKKGSLVTYALEYSPLHDWLGMCIDNETLNSYPERFIVAHCLWEMTFSGFSSREIEDRKNEILKRVEEAKQELEWREETING